MAETFPAWDGQVPISRLTQQQLIGQGRTAEVFLYQDRYAIKLFRPSFPKTAIENEYLVCSVIGSMLDIPKVHARLTIDGRDAIVFDFIKGESGMKYLLRNPWGVKHLAEQFAGLHARIHSIPMPHEVPDLKAVLTRNMDMHGLLPEESKKTIIRYLETLPDGTTLCHGDFHPDNILLHDRNVFVLDWMTASRGNPLADVARTAVLLQWAQPGPGMPAVIRALLGTVRNKFYDRYVTQYVKLTGARLEDIQKWELPVMAARLMEWIPLTEKALLISKVNEKLKSI